jgi:hypothetical protein
MAVRMSASPIQNHRIFNFLHCRPDDKRLWTEWYQALSKFNFPLLSSWIKSWFAIVVPKYLKCATFSKNLLIIFMSLIWLVFWWWDSNIQLSVFTSRPTSLLALIKIYKYACTTVLYNKRNEEISLFIMRSSISFTHSQALLSSSWVKSHLTPYSVTLKLHCHHCKWPKNVSYTSTKRIAKSASQ